MNINTSYFFNESKFRPLFLIGLMLFVSTSTFPFFSDMLARANIQIIEINEEENGSHGQGSKGKVGSYYSTNALYKFLSNYSTGIASIIYFFKKHADYISEVCTPPPQFKHTI